MPIDSTINTILLDEAKAHVQEYVAPANAPPYSRYLQALQARVNSFSANPQNMPLDIRSEEPKHTTIVDPYKIDIARALGYSDQVALNMAAPEASKSHFINTTALDSLSYKLPSSQHNISVYSPAPMCISEQGNPNSVFIPISNGIIPDDVAITGFTHEQNLKYINAHESWHCRVQSVSIGKDDKAEHFASRNRSESFADLGAMGDMIRDGENPSIIDKLAAWRNAKVTDVEHRTTPALTALKDEIEKMGVDTFRALPEKEVASLYDDIAKRQSITPELAGKYLEYKFSSEDDRLTLKANGKDDPILQQAVSLYDSTKSGTDYFLKNRPAFKEGEFKQLQEWSALRELEDRAIKDSGKITPETLIKSYTALQGEYQESMRQQPDSLLLPEKSSLLQKTFIDTLSRLDYVKENQQYGIDISKTVSEQPAQQDTSRRPATQKMQI